MDRESVFVNCPFDNAYFVLLKPLLFTLVYTGFRPRMAETSDSGEVRLLKIKDLMMASAYSIHDLSRMDASKEGELPRFNMPFECGIDFGIRLSNEGMVHKKFLILEKEQHRYQRVISDISGNDIKAHRNDPEQMVKVVRDWFKPTFPAMPRHKEIWLAYAEFEFDYEEILTAEGYDPKDIHALTFSDIIENMMAWVSNFKESQTD